MLSEEVRFQMRKDRIRARLLKYTRKAFRMLPHLDKPRILDVGCGSGIPTLELARLSQGDVIGIDVDQSALDRLSRNIREVGLADRIKAVRCSMYNMDFSDRYFDVIWSEGSIYVIGFERGLWQWRRFLKPGGFMMVHDEQGNIKDKLEQIHKCGYDVLDYFILSEEVWQTEYFSPLEKLIIESRTRYAENVEVLGEINLAQGELDMFRQHPKHNSSVYFIMKKK